MTSTHARPHRPDQRPTDGGFTIIELLVAVIIIGILAGIAIPIYLNQRRSAHDAAVKSDLRNLAEAIEGAASDLKGPLFVGTGAWTIQDGHAHGVAVTLSDTTGIGVRGSDEAGYCIAAWSPKSGKYTSAAPLFYDSTAGGLGRTGGACDPAHPPVLGAPVTGRGPGGEPLGGGTNWLPDSSFQAPPAGRLYVSSLGSAGNVGSQAGGFWGVYDVASPAGNRALRVTTTSTTPQGVILFQDDALPMTSAQPIVYGQQYTVSAWVKAPAGQAMTIVARVTDANRGWRGESPRAFTGTGAFERVSWTVTGTASTQGHYLALQVQTAAPTTSGVSFEIAGPQIQQGVLGDYVQSAP